MIIKVFQHEIRTLKFLDYLTRKSHISVDRNGIILSFRPQVRVFGNNAPKVEQDKLFFSLMIKHLTFASQIIAILINHPIQPILSMGRV